MNDETAKPRHVWTWSLAGCCAAMLWLGAYFGGRNAGFDAGHAEGIRAAHPRAIAIGRVQGFRETKERHSGTSMYEEVYLVEDVIYDRLNKQPGQALSKAELNAALGRLVSEIAETVDPESWPALGGTGVARIASFPMNRTLVISQTAAIHSEIASYLGSKEDYLAWKKATETR